MSDDTTHHVNESADKIQVDTKVKRGSDTRDQDVIKARAKGNDPEEVVRKLDETVALLRGTSDTLRSTQPEGENVLATLFDALAEDGDEHRVPILAGLAREAGIDEKVVEEATEGIDDE